MPELIQCPECDRKLKIPDNLMGKNVKCPSCGATFRAEPGDVADEDDESPPPGRRPAARDEEQIEERPSRRRAPAPRDEEEDEDEPRARRRGRDEEEEPEDEEEERPRRRSAGGGGGDWGKVQTGVTLVMISLFVLIGSVLVGMIGGMIVGAAGASAAMQQQQKMMQQQRQQPGFPGQPPPQPVFVPAGPSTGQKVLGAVVSLIQLVASGLAVAGYFLCMSVPPRTGAKGLATTAFALGAAALAFELISNILQIAGTGAAAAGPGGLAAGGAALGVGGILGLLAGLLTVAKNFCFFVFLKNVGNALRAPSVARNATVVLSLYAALFVLILVFAGVGVALLGGTILAMLGGTGGGAPPNFGAIGSGVAGGMVVMCGVGCLAAVVGLTWLVWYIVLLALTRGAIANHARRR